ncbi:hypothetical protein [Parasitella parasitica]|uniref:Uncharacterized protein n=1 Tax=Parasitella parasitica TaxID=35722 RepID=A0A0B7NIY2_9FUNG|nr:hypothetical protein [Parasitella parasitica]
MIQNHDLTLQDFQYQEDEALYTPTFIDPGRKSVFMAVIDLGDEHQVRECSAAEYYHLTGSTPCQNKLQKMKDEAGITTIESSATTKKTFKSTAYNNYAIYALN